MSTLTVAGHSRRINPALIITGLALAGAGCLVVAVVQVLTAPAPALLLGAVLALAGWLVKTATGVVALPTLGCLAALTVVSPWLLALAVLAVLTLHGGESHG
ncbi:MAG: hypothetical protein ACRDTE_15885 [Pseudonocardiaceae bacterium]